MWELRLFLRYTSPSDRLSFVSEYTPNLMYRCQFTGIMLNIRDEYEKPTVLLFGCFVNRSVWLNDYISTTYNSPDYQHLNVERHIGHTIVSWPYRNHWPMGYTSDLIMITYSTYIITIITMYCDLLRPSYVCVSVVDNYLLFDSLIGLHLHRYQTNIRTNVENLIKKAIFIRLQ